MRRLRATTLGFILFVAAAMFSSSQALAVEYAGRLFRDPFGQTAQVNTAQPEKPKKNNDLVLEGVIWSATKPQALIAGKLVKVGDVIGDSTVIDIQKQIVKLKDKDKEYTIRFKRGSS